MSLCYHVVCRDCRKDVWAGQGKKLYRTEKELCEVEQFLHAHYMHSLTFMETNDLADLKRLWNEQASLGTVLISNHNRNMREVAND